MKKSAYTRSALIKNRQFRARVSGKQCGHFNEVGRKDVFCTLFDDRYIGKIIC